MTDLLVGLSLTIGVFFILLLLYFVYLFQDKRTGIIADLFKAQVIIDAILIISELISSYLLYDKLSPTIGEILLKIHWYTGIAYFYCFYFYADAHLNNIENITKKEYFWKRKEGKIITIITIITTVVFCIVQFGDLNYHALSYLPGYPAYTVFAYATVLVLILFFKYLFKKNKSKNQILFMFLFLLAPLLDLVLQIIWQNVAFSPTFVAIILIGSYFLLENPDLYVANELEKIQKNLEAINIHRKGIIRIKSQNVVNELYGVVNSNYNVINNKNKEQSKQIINNNTESIIDLVYDMENIFNMLIINENKNVIENYDYSSIILLSKLYNYSLNRVKGKNVEIVFDIDQFLPITLNGNKFIVYQILLYSMYIATKNTSEGNVSLKIDCNFTNNQVIINIKIDDDGIPFNEDIINQINADYKSIVEDSFIENFVIIKEYVSYLNGSFRVIPSNTKGNTISISFVQNISNPTKIGEFKPYEINYNLDFTGRKVLIIDSHPEDVIKMIKKYNINYETSSSFDEGVNKLKIDNTYTTVLLNLDLVQNNNEAVNAIKLVMVDHPGIKNKVMALSSNMLVTTRTNIFKEGFDCYVMKPYNKYDFDEMIKKI